MRIIRYRFKQRTEFGCIEDGRVYKIVGNPLKRIKRGRYAAAMEDVELESPCLPRKIIAVAINFPGIDGYSPKMSEPMVFIKPGTCVCAPGAKIFNPFPGLPWWGEAELAVVIKDFTKDISIKEVKKKVLGFTIANDVTVENIEGRDHHLARSKCPDSFCPIGPWIDTGFHAADCLIEAVQNGEVIRRGRSSEQVWQWSRIISWLSTWMTLEPWDVVLTGNPPDTVGMRYLEDGDIYTARIRGLGELTNSFYTKK